MQKLAIASLALVILLVSLSAYLRLDHSGIGCEPWPTCYGNIGVVASEVTIGDAYERLLADARQPMSWARPLHRLVASVLGIMILALALMAVIRKRDRMLALSLLFLTVFLAWLGIYSEGINNPAIVMGNLAGGFSMLGLLGWMVFRQPPGTRATNRSLRSLAFASLAVLSLQILFGGLTSANFAASACQTVPDCHGSWLPGKNLADAFDITQAHRIGASGNVLGGAERADIQKLHRLTAILAVALIIALVIAAIRAGARYRSTATALLVIVTAEFTVGVAAILTQLPIALAVAHNWLAAILLLSLLRLIAVTRSQSDPL
ncbi:MAG: COX15/CtaA family protein [Proteobacteria bacterium]|nr:COX15/CtaA family protein [Pseudomonadota bacterium]